MRVARWRMSGHSARVPTCRHVLACVRACARARVSQVVGARLHAARSLAGPRVTLADADGAPPTRHCSDRCGRRDLASRSSTWVSAPARRAARRRFGFMGVPARGHHRHVARTRHVSRHPGRYPLAKKKAPPQARLRRDPMPSGSTGMVSSISAGRDDDPAPARHARCPPLVPTAARCAAGRCPSTPARSALASPIGRCARSP